MKGAAGTLRPNPAFDTATAMTELQIGEVLISVLDDRGSPSVTERAFVYPPRSRFAPLTPDERMEVIRASPLRTTYTELIDRESAYELLKKRAESIPPLPESQGRKTPAGTQKTSSRASGGAGDILGSAAKSAARSLGTQLGRAVLRGVLGSLSGRR